MKIELQEPYKSLYRLGYLRESKDGRKRIDLFNSNDDRTTVSYARYLLAVKIGRLLEDYEEVDHIDRDCSNDSIENLQLLSKEEHRFKTKIEMSTGRKTEYLKCAFCGKIFEREVRLNKSKYGYKNTFCSRSCNGKFSKLKTI